MRTASSGVYRRGIAIASRSGRVCATSIPRPHCPGVVCAVSYLLIRALSRYREHRDTSLELQARAALSAELPIEPDLECWFSGVPRGW
jgi:hypothetical protein